MPTPASQPSRPSSSPPGGPSDDDDDDNGGECNNNVGETVVLDVPRIPSLATHHKVVQGVHWATTHRLQAKANDNVHLC